MTELLLTMVLPIEFVAVTLKWMLDPESYELTITEGLLPPLLPLFE